MGHGKGRKPEHLFVETDGQVYLVHDRGVWRFPTDSEAGPFPLARTAPEEWFQRDSVFSRADVDGLVKKAVYMTMPRLVAEVVFVRRGKVLMEMASRGFSKGYWNLPGGFLEFGEGPEDTARRECEEELGGPVRIDAPLAVYLSGFP